MPGKNGPAKSLATMLEQGLAGPVDSKTASVRNVDTTAIHGERDRAIREMRKLLVESGRIFKFNDDIVMEGRSAHEGKKLVILMNGDQLVPAAPSHLSNLFHCEMVSKQDEKQTYQVPRQVASEVLNNEMTRDQLPRIAYYARRPVFNAQFEFRSPAYWPEDKLLVHGDSIEPILWEPPNAARMIDRLPPGLRRVFVDFCFADEADLVSAISILLTGVLANQFIDDGKPMFVNNGNQRGVGKTLLAQSAGLILDGVAPDPIKHSDDDDEMGKRIGARIQPGKSKTVLLFDNRKGDIGGELVESLVLAPKVSVRRLGKNEDISHDNDFLWLFTAANAKATRDSTSRAVIINLYHEGDPSERLNFDRSEQALKDHIRRNRNQLLGELFGMVVRWTQAGRTPATTKHRLTRWSQIIGGILNVAGVGEIFLANQQEAILEIDDESQQLVTLLEFVAGQGLRDVVVEVGVDSGSSPGKSASEWLPFFRDARVCQAELTESSERSQAIAVGKFLAANLNKPTPIQVRDRTGSAHLTASKGRGRRRLYWILVRWDGVSETNPAPTESAITAVSGAMPPAIVPTVIIPPASSTNRDSGPAQVSATGNRLQWEADGE